MYVGSSSEGQRKSEGRGRDPEDSRTREQVSLNGRRGEAETANRLARALDARHDLRKVKKRREKGNVRVRETEG